MRTPSPTLAAVLSFIWPGLGQVYAGDTRRGIIWMIPMFVLVIAGAWFVLGGSAIAAVLNSNIQVALLIFNIAFFFYHVAAMIDAYDVARHDRTVSYSRPRGAPIALAILVAITIMIHGFPEVYGYEAHNTYVSIVPSTPRPVVPSHVAQTPNPSIVIPTDVPDTTPPSGSPAATGTPTGSGSPTGSGGPQKTLAPHVCPPPPDLSGWAPAADGRLNLLLVGGDSRSDTGLDAKSLRTDSMILLSVDINSCKAALFSFPRNLCTATDGSCGDGTRYPDWLQIPLPDEDTQTPAGQAAFPSGTFTAANNICQGINSDGLLTSLWHIAAWCDQVFQGSDGVSGSACQQDFTCDRAWRALIGTLQNFTGQNIDGVVAVNLNGFVDLVNALPAQCPTDAQRVALPSTPKCYGGLWLQTDSLQDDAYYDSQQNLIPVDFQPGCYYVDPEYSLAYARSRHQDSDYQRERRQQYVLQQVRRQLDPIGLLPNLTNLLAVAQANLYTSFSNQDMGYLAQVASRVDANYLYTEDFAPAHLTALGSMQGIKDEVTNIFSQPEPTPAPQQANNPCPAK
jgi:anionic cell wall polymer biosynthesis LytR-Cps2A-Psr (LCP) family protein/TM2 domain-containing membrane protein YozV